MGDFAENDPNRNGCCLLNTKGWGMGGWGVGVEVEVVVRVNPTCHLLL